MPTTNTPIEQEPPLTKWEADVRRLIAEIKVSRGPSGKLNQLLQKVGCVTNSTIWMGFKEPRPDRRATVIEALVFASSVYATLTTSTDSLDRLMHAIAALDAWGACIAEPPDAYAFVKNSLVLLDHRGTKPLVLRMLRSWLRPPNQPYRSNTATALVSRDILIDLFGEHWWMFNAPDGNKKVDPNIILRQRPAFLPGVLPAVVPDNLLDLPIMDLG